MKITGIIPARYASTRFPGKPLADIAGKSMIRRVWEQACKAPSLAHVVVATDDRRIFDHLSPLGCDVVMTSAGHRSGSERCHEAIRKTDGNVSAGDVVINIQGDEPFIQPEQIEEVARLFRDRETVIGTLAKKIASAAELSDPNKVKVVLNQDKKAIYFSRQPIPYLAGKDPVEWHLHYEYYSHVGIYGYRVSTLKQITQLAPSPLEQAESLEQLRWIENDIPVTAGITVYESLSVDTPEDVEKLLKSRT